MRTSGRLVLIVGVLGTGHVDEVVVRQIVGVGGCGDCWRVVKHRR
jgi:hypothetical protein